VRPFRRLPGSAIGEELQPADHADPLGPVQAHADVGRGDLVRTMTKAADMSTTAISRSRAVSCHSGRCFFGFVGWDDEDRDPSSLAVAEVEPRSSEVTRRC